VGGGDIRGVQVTDKDVVGVYDDGDETGGDDSAGSLA